MAIVSVGWEVTINLLDRGSNATSRVYNLDPDVNTYTEAIAAKDQILAALLDVTDLGVTGILVREKFEENAFSVPTAATAEVSAHAEISGVLNGFTTKRGTIDIPGPKDTLWVASTGPNYNVIDTGNAEVLAYAGLFGVAANIVTISDGEQFAAAPALVGKRTHTKSRKG